MERKCEGKLILAFGGQLCFAGEKKKTFGFMEKSDWYTCGWINRSLV